MPVCSRGADTLPPSCIIRVVGKAETGRSTIILLLLFLFGLVPCFGQPLRSLQTGAVAPTGTLRNYPLGSLQWAFRVHGLPGVAPSTDIVMVDVGNTQCWIPGGTLHLACRNQYDNTPAGIPQVSFSRNTDIRVLLTRNRTAGTTQIDLWNGDCRGHVSALTPTPYGGHEPAQSSSGFALGGGGLAIAFFRSYSEATASPSCPADAPSAVAPLMDFRFEGDTRTDVSGNQYTLASGGTSFVDSPWYPPTVIITGWTTAKPVFSANAPFTLDGSSSRTFTGTGTPASYLWEQVVGPPAQQSLFFPNNIGGTSITVSGEGTYQYRLTATDDFGAMGTATLEVGAVATDENGVRNPPGKLGVVLGPVTRHGVNPWPWYDFAEAWDADVLYAPQTTPPAPAAPPYEGAGKVTSKCCGTIIVEGTGTHWLTGGPTQKLQVGQNIWVEWDADGPGSRTGRWIDSVSKVLDDTHFMLGSFEYRPPLAASQSVLIQKPGPDITAWTYLNQPNSSWNYYDNILGLYRLAQRTNLSVYLGQARTFCSLWWQYGLDHGYMAPTPRNAGHQGMMACAADNQPTWWDQIAYNVLHSGASLYFSPTQPIGRVNGWDPRESAYITRATALLAKLYPAHSSDSDGTRQSWCGYLTNQVRNMWLPNFVTLNNGTDGYWEEDLFYWNSDFPAAGTPAGPPAGARFGTSPWRDSGLATLALIQAHDVFADPTACNNPVLAGQLFDVIQKSAQFIWDYGRSSDGGLYYNVEYQSNQASSTGTGSIRVTKGSDQVIGTGTAFTKDFAPCDGSSFIGIHGLTGSEGVYQVMSCSDATHLKLNQPYAGITETIAKFTFSQRASANCAPAIGHMCEPDAYSGKNLSHDAAASFGWLYYKTKQAQWKDKLEYMLGKAYGGPATGPGTVGPPAGPQADGKPNNFDSILPLCGNNPCTRSPWEVGLAQQGKPFGMSAGAGNAPNAIAYYYGVSVCSDLILTPGAASVPVEGGSGTTAATVTDQSCQWSATSSADWLSITHGDIGTGNGTISWTVAANGGDARSATITVGPGVFTVSQAGTASAGMEKVKKPLRPARLEIGR